jgi:hypothetical protein
VPPPVDLLWVHPPTPGDIRNSRTRHQRFSDDRRRPAAATDRPSYNLNTSIVTPCIIIAVKYNGRLKLHSASDNTSISIAAVKEGR